MSLADRKIWKNGALIPFAEATVHLLSQSLQRGTLIFDVLPVYWPASGPHILGLREHLQRFQQSAELSGMPLPYDLGALGAGMRATVHANPKCEIAKISAYWPGASFDVLPVDDRPDVAIAAFDVLELMKTGRASAGGPAKLHVSRSQKMPASVLSPQLKIAAAYTHASFAKREARSRGFHDALFLDAEGNFTECSAQSFFLVVDGMIRTAPLDSVLDGVTRRIAIDLARDEGFEVKEERLAPDLLARASEAFVTGTSANVWGVGQIGEKTLASPGPVVAKLTERFKRLVLGEDAQLGPRWFQAV